ncbi:MAG: triose-phosphate isomerase [Candidatus Falkowbacteria bacterium]|nr:triose-phosphate isomerase [Candidatus Falkowbacteria bacterium]
MSKIFVSNWKMQLNYSASLKLANDFKKKFKNFSGLAVLCPDFLSLAAVAQIIKTTPLKLGAQDCSLRDQGAYTGEVSARNLKALGANYVIIGHSERRQYFFETEAIINQKLRDAQVDKLIPILCVGESLAERKVGLTKAVLKNQLRLALKNIKPGLIIAYEPIWAIGSGRVAKSEEVELIHAFIKQEARQILKKAVKVIYGGSVTAADFASFKKTKNIDGFLVGGASLKATEFHKICQL